MIFVAGGTDELGRRIAERLRARDVELRVFVGRRAFVFVSFPIPPRLARAPLAAAKLATEERLARSSMREVIVRPEMFHEIWLTSAVGLDWEAGKAQIFGKGETPNAYVAIDDVAEATVRLALANDPPREFLAGDAARRVGGPVPRQAGPSVADGAGARGRPAGGAGSRRPAPRPRHRAATGGRLHPPGRRGLTRGRVFV